MFTTLMTHIYIFHLACVFIIYFLKCMWVFWTACVTVHHVCILYLWKLEEGNRSPKLELQLIVSHHVVLGTETGSSLKEQPVGLGTGYLSSPCGPLFLK